MKVKKPKPELTKTQVGEDGPTGFACHPLMAHKEPDSRAVILTKDIETLNARVVETRQEIRELEALLKDRSDQLHCDLLNRAEKQAELQRVLIVPMPIN